MPSHDASNVPTQLLDINSHSIAYRSLGAGMPLILSQRLHGTLDSWDPLFLDTLADHFRVIIFDYSGSGGSTGEANLCIRALAEDIIEFADALGIDIFVGAGWSAGALAMECLAMLYPDRISHIVLISAVPLTKSTLEQRKLLYQQAILFDNDPDHEMALFFGQASELTRLAAESSYARMALRTEARSPLIPQAAYKKLLADAVNHSSFTAENKIERFLESTEIPIMVISGACDIICPTRNWFQYIGVWQSLHFVAIPQAGHAPQHRDPQLCANLLISFVTSVRVAE